MDSTDRPTCKQLLLLRTDFYAQTFGRRVSFLLPRSEGNEKFLHICPHRDTDRASLLEAHADAGPFGDAHRSGSPRSLLPFPHPPLLLAEPDHDRLHVFGGSPVLHQEVDHALRLDHQVAPEEEDAEHDGEREHAQHGDLHHAHHKHLALVLQQHQGAAAVAGHHAVRGSVAGVGGQSPGQEGLAPVEERALGRVEEGDVHGVSWCGFCRRKRGRDSVSPHAPRTPGETSRHVTVQKRKRDKKRGC